jgi:multidrug resistance efflux pump
MLTSSHGFREVHLASPFSRSLRSLHADGRRPWAIALLVAAVLLGGWVAWFFAAEVTVYAVTSAARLEVEREVHPVEAPVSGQVVAHRLVLGQETRAGDILVELDTGPLQRELDEERARLKVIEPQIRALRAEIRAEELALRESRLATQEALKEARARHREGEAAVRLAQDQLKRLNKLVESQHASEAEVTRAQAQVQQSQAAAQALEVAVSRLEYAERTKEMAQKARIERLRRDVAALEGEEMTRKATIARLRYEMERRRIRAPVAGRLGEISALRIGSVVQAGDRMGAIIPAGTIRVIADYLPSEALGRVQAGQTARLRLDGFPWTQYGTIQARVSKVASEARYGRIRVELDLEQPQNPRIPLEHGLPGTVEVEVERVSPAVLVLRAAGHLLGAPARSAGSAP